jgi:hypothetical protein
VDATASALSRQRAWTGWRCDWLGAASGLVGVGIISMKRNIIMIRLLIIVIASIQLAGCAGVGVTADIGDPDQGMVIEPTFGLYGHGFNHDHGFDHGHFRR